MEISPAERVGFSPTRLKRIGPTMHRYVDDGKLAGIITLVCRRGQVVHLETCGWQNMEAGKRMEVDTIFRIYSMTKPITSVALMMLYEQGCFQLSDPVYRFIPEFKEVKVYIGEGKEWPLFDDLAHDITIQELLTHTAGLTYDFLEDSRVDEMYRRADLRHPDIDLAEMVRRIAKLSLVHQPGQAWRYSFATDVVGYLVEVISGQPLDQYFEEHIFGPLGMVDTGFDVPKEKIGRFATLYGMTEASDLGIMDEPANTQFARPVRRFSGGGGLVSTTADYLRFAQLCLNQGELDGVRLLGRKTMELMTMNHIPSSLLPLCLSEPLLGMGFGLGFSVLMDVAASGQVGSEGSYGWGGAASTNFWVDPQEALIGILMLQFMPSGHYPIREEFKVLTYQALVD